MYARRNRLWINIKILAEVLVCYLMIIGSDSITVQFNSGATYFYTYQSAGSSNVEQMKSLAIMGKGLNSFISRIVKNKYASKIM